MDQRPLLLIGCGVLQAEVRWLIELNRWPLETLFLDSMLHIDFEQLGCRLTSALAQHAARNPVVFYGACHPRMEQMLTAARVARTPGQNCVAMLLGQERFEAELTQGAFFLLEDWARRWERVLATTFGDDLHAIRAIFQGDRKYLLGVRTPRCGDFTADAEAAARSVGLPLRWMNAGLEHLEAVLREAIAQHVREVPCPR